MLQASLTTTSESSNAHMFCKHLHLSGLLCSGALADWQPGMQVGVDLHG